MITQRKNNHKEKMNLGQLMNFLKDKKIIKKTLYKQIDTLRLLRNEQHIGAHTKVKKYTTADLEKVFEVTRKVKDLVNKSFL